MQQTQPARYAEPFFSVTATGDAFENALRDALPENNRSMHVLQLSIRNCVASLRDDDQMQCEQALLQ